jgi:2-polyprenyl-6-methoxyphenol hydroxylase-like FAD-dependent oxidoreductase
VGVRKNVNFGEICTGYSNRADRLTVTFASGKEVGAELLVGCDGVHSAIRNQMNGDTRHYLGIASLQGWCANAPASLALDGGPVMVLGRGSTLFMLKVKEGVGWSLTMRAPEKQFDGFSPAALTEHAVAATRGWAASFERVIDESDPGDMIALGGCYDKNPQTKACETGVALLGDAAHRMSPFRGEGANTAMQDSLVLAGALTNSELKMGAALSFYEREMLDRSRKYVLISRKAADEMHTTSWWVPCKRDAKLMIANFVVSRQRRRVG